MIRIFYCNSSDESIPSEISEYRLSKILSAKKDKLAQINTARVLKAGFATFGIKECEVIYEITESGKPLAKNFPSVHFSISHSDNFSIVAFFEDAVGIDCEKKNKKISNEVLARFFSAKEISDFSDFPMRLWTSKEAYVKYTGKGLAMGRSDVKIPYYFNKILFSNTYFERFTIGNYECAVCTSRSDTLQIQKVI